MSNEGETQLNDGEIIEGGQIAPFEDLPYNPEKHLADTARTLAYLLVAILALTILIHYGTSIYLRLSGHEPVADGVARIFDVWLPIISSLATGAVTHYFSKDK